MNSSKVVLELKNITKRFPGVIALNNVNLSIKPGTVHALMGENGAGKSTLMKCVFGIYTPDEGHIYIEGQEVKLSCARDAMDKGISMIHQELHPVNTQNVMENLWIGRIPYKKVLGVKFVDKKKMLSDTQALLKELDIDVDVRTMVGDLSVSHCQLIEIVRAVSYNAKVIIMDEPTSSLTETETKLLFEIIDKLRKQNVAIIYISHKIEEILQISDEVTILRDGMFVGNWDSKQLTQDMIISRMVGRELKDRIPKRLNKPAENYLKVENLTSENPKSFKNVSFSVRRGEVVGIGGLVGSQRTELIEAIFGLRKTIQGKISIDGKEVEISCPKDAIKNGMALLTEDRRSTGIISMLSVMENTVLAKQTASKKNYRNKLMLINNKKRKRQTTKHVKSLSIKAPNIMTQIQYLSGGNQQKVLLGRWLLTQPDILILDEPTRGIDVGAKYEIYSLIQKMACEGKSIIIVSSEMPELMGMSDRIMVMYDGHLSGIIDGKDATEEKIMHLASSYTV